MALKRVYIFFLKYIYIYISSAKGKVITFSNIVLYSSYEESSYRNSRKLSFMKTVEKKTQGLYSSMFFFWYTIGLSHQCNGKQLKSFFFSISGSFHWSLLNNAFSPALWKRVLYVERILYFTVMGVKIIFSFWRKNSIWLRCQVSPLVECAI